MEKGKCVRLKMPFNPCPVGMLAYRFGLIAEVVSEGSRIEILLQLYDPESAAIYRDEFNEPALYSFRPEELVLSDQSLSA